MCDALSYLVSVLGIIVSVLIGWQIFAVIDMNRIRKELKNSKRIVKDAGKRADAQLLGVAKMSMSSLLVIFSTILYKKHNLSLAAVAYVECLLLLITLADETKDFGSCDEYADTAIKELKRQNLKVSSDQKKALLDSVLEIKSPKKIKRYAELLSLIYALECEKT